MATTTSTLDLVADVGFTILSDPKDAAIDIVFVHGLQGHPQNTWTYKPRSARSPARQPSPSSKISRSDKTRTLSIFHKFSKRKHLGATQLEEMEIDGAGRKGEGDSQGKDVFWPRDLLKDDFPTARIMTFGYNTNITQGYHATNQSNIFSHARDLLYELEAKRRKVAGRNLIFIAHSLGGILVKEVLRRSEVDPDPKINTVFASTVGVFFFGTPHRGSKNWASFGEGVASIAGRLLGVDTNNQVIHALLPTGPELELCRESFMTQWVKRGNTLIVRTFQESKGVVGVQWGGFNRLIVPPDSSSLDHPNQRARTIDEDHIGMVKFTGLSDRNYQMVRDDIEELVENSQAPSNNSRDSGRARNVHWKVPRAVNSLFTGRSELLDRMQSALKADQTLDTKGQKRLVITGLGGQGKSEICLKAANLMRDDFWGVFWIDVSTPSAAENGFNAVATALGTSAESIDDSLQALSSTEKDWLLILDNADDPRFDYKVYIPSGTQGVVIMTSRIPACSRYSTVKSEALEGLDIKHSIQLLLKAARVSEESWQSYEKPARDVVCLLGSHTLALIQAGAYIAEGYCRLEQYPEKYQQQRKRLLKYYLEQEQSRYRDIYATFEASADVLKHSKDETGKDALDLLDILSMLHFSVLPIVIFEHSWRGSRLALDAKIDKINEACSLGRWHVFQLPEFIGSQSEEWDDYRLMRAIYRLTSLSLVTKHHLGDLDGLSMHPLTHAWAKDRQQPESQEQSWIATGCVIATAWFSSRNLDSWQIHRSQLRSHVLFYLDIDVKKAFVTGPDNTILPILLYCGHGLRLWRDDTQLEQLLNAIFEELKIDPRNPSKAFVELYDLKARNCMDKGQIRVAVHLFEEVIKIYVDTQEESAPHALSSQQELAIAYLYDGQGKKAIQLLQHATKVQKKSPAEDDPGQLRRQHILAEAYLRDTQVKKAVKLLEYVTTVQGKLLAEEHPDRLSSEGMLARAYLEDRQVEKAIELLEYVVTVEGKVLAEEHPDRLTSQHGLASAYLEDGQVEKAVELLEHVVTVQEKVLAEEHPHRLVSQHGLASAYLEDRQVEKAVELLEHVVIVRGKVLAEEHPHRLVSQHELARAYLEDRQVEKAVELLEHVVTVREKVLAEEHPDRLTSQHELARAYATDEQVEKAIELLEHVVTVKEKVLAAGHPSQLVSQHELAINYYNKRQIEKAIELMEDVVAVRERVLRADHPDLLGSQGWLSTFKSSLQFSMPK